MQDELFIEDRKAARGPDTQALVVHVLHCRVPFLQATAEIVQVESRDCYLRQSHHTTTRSPTAIDRGNIVVSNFFCQGGKDTEWLLRNQGLMQVDNRWPHSKVK